MKVLVVPDEIEVWFLTHQEGFEVEITEQDLEIMDAYMDLQARINIQITNKE